MTNTPTQNGQRAIPAKWQVIIDYLPECLWNVTKAARKAGYSDKYINTSLHSRVTKDPRFQQAVEQKRKELEKNNKPIIEQIRDRLLRSIEACEDEEGKVKQGLMNAHSRYIDLYGKTYAAFAEKHINEDSDEIKELREKEALEAERLANIRLREVS